MRQHLAQYGPADIALCSVVKAELMVGALRSSQALANMQSLQTLFMPLHSFDFDDHAAQHYAEVRLELTAQGRLIGANDLLIAAIARANKLIVVTHNTGEFTRVSGLTIEDWQV